MRYPSVLFILFLPAILTDWMLCACLMYSLRIKNISALGVEMVAFMDSKGNAAVFDGKCFPPNLLSFFLLLFLFLSLFLFLFHLLYLSFFPFLT